MASARSPQAVDPVVSRAKFDREVDRFCALRDEHIRRGWWLLDASWPQVLMVFAAPQLKPPAVVFGAVIDFTDFDFRPPSVRLVDPFTREPYRAKELPTILKRAVPAPAGLGIQILGEGIALIAEQPLMQAYGPDEVPFLCVPGVREYHEHPGHSGDPWALHRGGPEGTLHFVLDVLYRYGVQPISEYQVTARVSGFRQRQPTE